MPTEAEAFHAALTGGMTQAPDPTAKPEPAQEPAAAAPAPAEGKKSLEDLLTGLDEDARKVVLGEVSKARSEAKNLRDRLKEAEPKVAEYDRLAQASQSDVERATERASAAEARAAAASQRVARAEVKAALAGLVDDPESIIEDLNLARFVSDDGEVNDDAIASLKSKYAAFGSRRAPRPDPSQASGGNGQTTASPAQEFASLIQAGLRSG